MALRSTTAARATRPPLGWVGIVRLGLVQMSLGAVVVMMTSTINRVMVVELSLPAMIPGLLVALHYAIQVLRPRWGYGSDVGGRRTPWIIGGMAALAMGGLSAAASTAVFASSFWGGLAVATLAFTLLGIGVGAAGTSVLALLAVRVAPQRRAAAATIVWVMMIFGLAATASIAGRFIDPFSPARLIAVMAAVAAGALLLSTLAVWGVEGEGDRPAAEGPQTPFFEALREVWAEPEARRFTVFVFVSMLAYNAQELILEPFAGLVFGLTAGQSTALAGVQHGGVLAGMLLVSVGASVIGGRILGSLRVWTVGGCLASAVAIAAVAAGGAIGPEFPLRGAVFALGLANGAFAVAAIGSMMSLAGAGETPRAGTRLGLWGAAQAIAFGLGGLAGALVVDVARKFVATPVEAYGLAFLMEAALFVAGAWLALGIGETKRRPEAGAALGGRLVAGSGAR